MPLGMKKVSRWGRLPLLVLLLASAPVTGTWLPETASAQARAGGVAKASACPPLVLEGSVRAGEAWQAAISPTEVLKLEAVPAGWMMRVLPKVGSRPPHDAAELANPPYRSPTPILISTDFAFRAQDAIAWNPRRFRFFATAEQVARAEAIYRKTLQEPNNPATARELAEMLAGAPEATLEIVDAAIRGGTANQTAVAAGVALHLAQTAHTLVTEGGPTPLGTLVQMRFRVTVPALGPGCLR